MAVQDPLAPDSSRRLPAHLPGSAQIDVAPVARISRRAPGDRVPLSFGQRQIWLRAQFAGELPLYNESVTVRRLGECDHTGIERAFNEILRRHETWRTSFEIVHGEPVQIVHPFMWLGVPLIDLRHLPESAAEGAYRRLCAAGSGADWTSKPTRWCAPSLCGSAGRITASISCCTGYFSIAFRWHRCSSQSSPISTRHSPRAPRRASTSCPSSSVTLRVGSAITATPAAWPGAEHTGRNSWPALYPCSSCRLTALAPGSVIQLCAARLPLARKCACPAQTALR